MEKYITNNELETQILAKDFSKKLKPNDIIALIGDLGTGKTAFTKGLARGLDINELITSPTFTLINEYYGKYPLFHFDLYRLGTFDELYSTGYDEYFTKNGICVIEWADKFLEELPNDIYVIEFKYIDEKKREIKIYDKGEKRA